MVKDVTKFHQCHLRGRGMLEFWEGGGGKFQSLVLTWRGCIAHNS